MAPTLQDQPLESADALRAKYAAVALACEPQLLRHALRLCGGNLDRASDLTQDALIAGYASCLEGKLDFGGNLKAWFMRVVTTRFINEFNRNKRWISDIPVDSLDDNRLHSAKIALQPKSEDPVVESLFEEPLERALAQLPEDQRACVLLVDVEEMSYAEAAELLKVPVGTVRSRLARARIKLYSLLMPYAKSKGIL